jgi:hypothetical protein
MPAADSPRPEPDYASAERPSNVAGPAQVPTQGLASGSIRPGDADVTPDLSSERGFVPGPVSSSQGDVHPSIDRSEPEARNARPDLAAMAAMPSCTAPQLRRFIKSRPYVPMHELRRRFGINGTEDEVSSIDLGATRVYVGLPLREGSLLGELLRGGDIGYELSLDPRTPIVIGLYPMRPVARS